MSSSSPTFMVGVPRIFEKISNGAQQRADAAGRGAIFDRAATVAIAYGRASHTTSRRPSLWLRAQRLVFARLV
jgi:long-chain acyl-CoA synthetase